MRRGGARAARILLGTTGSDPAPGAGAPGHPDFSHDPARRGIDFVPSPAASRAGLQLRGRMRLALEGWGCIGSAQGHHAETAPAPPHHAGGGPHRFAAILLDRARCLLTADRREASHDSRCSDHQQPNQRAISIRAVRLRQDSTMSPRPAGPRLRAPVRHPAGRREPRMGAAATFLRGRRPVSLSSRPSDASVDQPARRRHGQQGRREACGHRSILEPLQARPFTPSPRRPGASPALARSPNLPGEWRFSGDPLDA
jgi:hypothetical protein